jgi:hypothetical protein
MIPPIILLACAGIVWTLHQEVSQARESVFRVLVEKTSQRVEDAFQAFFDPIARSLVEARAWSQGVEVDLLDATTLNARFMPVLEQLPHVSAILIANNKGQSYMLSRSEDGWRTRLTDVAKTGARATWAEWTGPQDAVKTWLDDLDYDPRGRPWFRGAVESGPDGPLFWTEPYTFFDAKEKGMTASLSWRARNAGDITDVIAFDVLLHEISLFTAGLQISAHGDVFVLTEDGRVIGPPHDERFQESSAIKATMLSHVDTLELPELQNAHATWKMRSGDSADIFQYTSEGVPMWGAFRPLPIGNRTLWLGFTIPENELAESAGANPHAIPLAVVIIGAAAFLVSIVLLRRHTRQVERLALENQRLSPENHLIAKPDDPSSMIRDLIQHGETEKVEFKSSIRWNLRSDKPGKEIELAWLKAIVAFLNSNGGNVLIGVSDDGQVLGLETNTFANDDKCLRHIGNLINQHIGVEFTQFIQYGIVGLDDKKIAFVRCSQSTTPAFLKNGKDEEFYVRTGPANQKLPPSQILKFIESKKEF